MQDHKEQIVKNEQPKKQIEIVNGIIKYPLITEKSINLMQKENKLVFITANSANKKEIKSAIEHLFKARVLTVNTQTLPDCKKKAIVKLAPEKPAMDIITELGLM